MLLDNARRTRPPIASGALPFFGHLFEFKRDPLALIKRAAKEQGPVFSLLLGPMRLYFMVGPEMNTEFFSQNDTVLSARKAYRFLHRMFNPRISLAAPEADYQHQRALVAPLLGGKRMTSHFEAMVRETENWLGRLGTSGRFDVTVEFERLTMYIISRAMLGDEFREQVTDEFHLLFRDLEKGVDLFLPSSLPLPKFIRSKRARNRLREMVRPIVEARRAAPAGNHKDFFQDIVGLPDTDGKPMSVAMVADIVLWLVFSGQTTTSTHLGWALIQLLQHSEWLSKVKSDLPDSLTADAIQRFDPMTWAIRETERMLSTSIALPRITERDYSINGYEIPRGAMVLLSPAAGHYLPGVFSNPDRYEPERFSPERAEDRQVKNALAGFSGGQHKCWGAGFAYTEMAVVLTLLLKKYDLELQTTNPRIVYTPVPHPERPTWLNYRARTGASGPVSCLPSVTIHRHNLPGD